MYIQQHPEKAQVAAILAAFQSFQSFSWFAHIHVDIHIHLHIYIYICKHVTFVLHMVFFFVLTVTKLLKALHLETQQFCPEAPPLQPARRALAADAWNEAELSNKSWVCYPIAINEHGFVHQ